MFEPPCCPHSQCSQHVRPAPGFCIRAGTYSRKVAPHRVQRYRCRTCRRTFSRQTFRADYRDHRPDINAAMFLTAASGVGIRQACRVHAISLRCGELKLRKICRHLRRLNLNARGTLEPGARFHFDELESYEGQRNARPLTIPVLIETESRFIVWAESETIRPRGKMTEKRRKAIEKAEERHGARKDRSHRAIERTLRRGAEMAEELPEVVLDTDEKSVYPTLAKQVFGEKRLVHNQTNSKLARTTWNPLFPINHCEAMLRDLMSRLRRETWLVSKTRRYLDLWLQLQMAYRNYVRVRFNHDRESPAQRLGFMPRRLKAKEVLSWRQDWGPRSVHPLSTTGETYEWVRSAAAAA
jgi:transposase-like protein